MLTLPSGIKHYGYDVAWPPPLEKSQLFPWEQKGVGEVLLGEEQRASDLTAEAKPKFYSFKHLKELLLSSEENPSPSHHFKACDGLLVSKLLDPIFFFFRWSDISCLRKQQITFQGTKHFPLFLQNNNNND